MSIPSLIGLVTTLSLLATGVNAEDPMQGTLSQWYREKFSGIAERLDYSDVPNIYVAPFRLQTGEGEIYLSDDQAVTEFMLGYGDSMRAANARSAEIKNLQVVSLNSNTALLVVSWTVRDADGKLITSCDPQQFLYLVAKHDTAWKIVGESLVDCDRNMPLKQSFE
jgi:NTF2-like protein (DUF6841)